jgi:hypothetical protein
MDLSTDRSRELYKIYFADLWICAGIFGAREVLEVSNKNSVIDSDVWFPQSNRQGFHHLKMSWS